LVLNETVPFTRP